jgi:hypothetical protein
MHCASSKRASAHESSDFSRSLRAGTEVGAQVGMVTGVGAVVAAFAAVEEEDDGAGVDPDYTVETEKSCQHKIYINKNCLLKINMELNTRRYIFVINNSSKNHYPL